MKIYKFDYKQLDQDLGMEFWQESKVTFEYLLQFKDFRRHMRLYTAIFKMHQIYGHFLDSNWIVFLFKSAKITKRYNRIRAKFNKLFLTVNLNNIDYSNFPADAFIKERLQ